jgi:hypothetical protein
VPPGNETAQLPPPPPPPPTLPSPPRLSAPPTPPLPPKLPPRSPSTAEAAGTSRAYDPRSDPGLVPVVVYGSSWGQSFALERVSDKQVVTQCPSNCTMHVWPGRYRLRVSDTDSAKGGTRVVTIEGPSTLFVDAPPRERRWAGLEIAVAGHLATVAGAALLLSSYCVEKCAGESGGSSRSISGLVLFAGGVTATVVGWVMFANGSHPTVKATPNFVRPESTSFLARPRALSVGYDPASRSAAAGASWSF